jgi:cephalosporin hydroxylase
MLRRSWIAGKYRVGKRLDARALGRVKLALYRSGVTDRITWLGTQASKNPLDLWVYQEILEQTRPDLIVETGSFRGGSALYLGCICELLGRGEVVSIDIEPVRDDYPVHPRVTFMGGRSSTDPDVVAEVGRRADGKRVMVILDSDHSQRHVEAEMNAYAALVTPGCYLIVEDTGIEQVRPDLMPGPMEAIDSFLQTSGEFGIDLSREKFLLTSNHRGYLLRRDGS